MAPLSVFADDTTFYKNNDIFFYNGSDLGDCSTTGNVVLTGSDNAEKIYNYLISTPLTKNNNQPLSKQQAAAFIGNFAAESGFDPKEVNSIGASGIAQWLGGRKDALYKMAADNNTTWDNLSLQLKYLTSELNGGESGIISDSEFQTSQSLDTLTNRVYVVFERAGSSDKSLPKRLANAAAYYSKFNNNSTPQTTDTSETNAAITNCGGEASAYVNNFAIYNQLDPQWKNNEFCGSDSSGKSCSTIGESGCGPSAMAMIITALTSQTITPSDTVSYANQLGNIYVPGAGSSFTIASKLADHWGLKTKKLSDNQSTIVTDINSSLRGGALIIVAGGGPSPFTSGGHFIVIRGVKEDNKWMIADSNGQAGIRNSSKEWDPNQIIPYATLGSIYAISK